MIAAARWLEVLTYCGVRALTAATWAPLFERYVQPDRFDLGFQEIDDFVGQVLFETAQLEHLEENLNYRPERLCQVWPERFRGLADAMPYAYNPEALAEKVYGRRPDLGNDAPGDGFKYIGRGIPMVTGKANYAMLEGLTHQPLVDFPVMLRNPDIALQCAILWWEEKVPDSAINTIERVTRAVQGGQLGLSERKRLQERAAQKLVTLGDQA